MLFVFYLVLILRAGRCTDDQIFETVEVGQTATLTCARKDSLSQETLFWIRLVSGNLPEVLGATYNFDFKDDNKTSHITKYNTKQEPGTFVLQIHQTKRSDTGVYYCINIKGLKMTFLNRTFLRIEGPEPEITAIIQDFPPDPVRPGDSVTLQCSLLTEKKTCPGDHSVFWFRAGSDESHPSVLYAHGNSGDECEKSPEAHSLQKCVYNFSKNISPSDAGTYYCAVASCGEILFGDGTKVDVEDNNQDLKNKVLFLLCAALAISLIVIASLIYTIKRKSSGRCNAFDHQRDAATVCGDQQSQQRDEDSLAYSAPTFTKRKTGKTDRRKVRAAEGETVYSDIRAFVSD